MNERFFVVALGGCGVVEVLLEGGLECCGEEV